MANEIQFRHYATTANLYAIIFNSAGQAWNGAAFEAFAVANWGDYDIPLSESPASGYRYVGTFPAAITAGTYEVQVYERAGASPAVSDGLLGAGDMPWDGSAELQASDRTGYALGSDGLDSVATTAPTGVATNFREMIVQLFWRLLGKVVISKTGVGAGTIKTYAADGETEVTSQAVSDDGTTQTLGAAE